MRIRAGLEREIERAVAGRRHGEGVEEIEARIVALLDEAIEPAGDAVEAASDILIRVAVKATIRGLMRGLGVDAERPRTTQARQA